MAGVCEACRNTITVIQKRIKCTQCSAIYHSECVNFSSESSSRSQWKCPTCVATTQRRGDNSNTPVRNASKAAKELTVCITEVGESSAQAATTASSLHTSPTVSPLSPITGLSPALHGSDIVGKIECILDLKLQILKKEIVKEMKGTLVTEFRKELATITNKYEHLETSHDNLQMEHAALKNEFTQLQKQSLEDRDKIKELQGQFSKQQQWARMCNIEIVGVPETPRESPVDLVLNIAKYAGVQLQASQIETAYRVQPMKKVEGRPKPIVVKLQTRMLKDQIISGLRKTKGISTRDIGLGGTNSRFFVNEHLTPENKQLLKATKDRAKAKSFKFVWVRNCNIFLRKNEETPVITIGSEKDLQKIA